MNQKEIKFEINGLRFFIAKNVQNGICDAYLRGSEYFPSYFASGRNPKEAWYNSIKEFENRQNKFFRNIMNTTDSQSKESIDRFFICEKTNPLYLEHKRMRTFFNLIENAFSEFKVINDIDGDLASYDTTKLEVIPSETDKYKYRIKYGSRRRYKVGQDTSEVWSKFCKGKGLEKYEYPIDELEKELLSKTNLTNLEIYSALEYAEMVDEDLYCIIALNVYRPIVGFKEISKDCYFDSFGDKF